MKWTIYREHCSLLRDFCKKIVAFLWKSDIIAFVAGYGVAW